MEDMAYVVFLGGVVVVLAALTWFASWAKRRGRGSGVAGAIAAYEEAYRTTAHQSHYELRIQARRNSRSGTRG